MFGLTKNRVYHTEIAFLMAWLETGHWVVKFQLYNNI